MNTEELSAQLSTHGINWQIEPMASFYALTLENARLHCTLPRKDAKRLHAGFWLHTGSELAFLGLWSGLIFHISRPAEIVDLAIAILGHAETQKQVALRTLPTTILDKYALHLCELIRAWPDSEADQLDDVEKLAFKPEYSLRTFLERLTPHVDACTVGPGGLVLLRLANASALTRFRGKEDEKLTSFPVLIYGGCPGTPEQNRLLQVVSGALGCVLYDPAWNNRIHWDDPYYSTADPLSRPEQPRNAPPVE
ncbi:MAG: hypothetical protein ABII12_02225 [Planctomycetota bacterium]